jgi:hypothetical protein
MMKSDIFRAAPDVDFPLCRRHFCNSRRGDAAPPDQALPMLARLALFPRAQGSVRDAQRAFRSASMTSFMSTAAYATHPHVANQGGMSSLPWSCRK